MTTFAAITSRRPHTGARSQENPLYPRRSIVPDECVTWSVPLPGYDPPSFTHAVVIANDRSAKDGGWADPPDPRAVTEGEWESRTSHEGQIEFDNEGSGRPRNPGGRTGLEGRGLLGKWGPNHAADPIVTRYQPAEESDDEGGSNTEIRGRMLQMVAIQRMDTGAWAIPGGMVDPGESVSQTVRREFKEEAGNLSNDPHKAAEFQMLAERLFSDDWGGGVEVYRGYVDDPRNTDHAWMETVAVHFHCPEELGRMLPLKAGDDAAKVTWLDCSDGDDRFMDLYASHKALVLEAKERLERKEREIGKDEL